MAGEVRPFISGVEGLATDHCSLVMLHLDDSFHELPVAIMYRVPTKGAG
jgi:hypothetical protein